MFRKSQYYCPYQENNSDSSQPTQLKRPDQMFLQGVFGIIWTKYSLTSVFFHHGAKSNQLATVEAAFKKHEDEKKGCIINASHHRCGEGDFYPTCSI